MIDYVTAAILLLLTTLFFLYCYEKSNYWKYRKVPHLKPVPIFGNVKSLMFLEKSAGEFVGDLHNSPEAVGQRFLGFYLFHNEPALLIRDPELVRNILLKDFHYFHDRYIATDEHRDPVGFNSLFMVKGKPWKYVRAKLSPLFTQNNVGRMFLVVKGLSEDLVRYIESNVIGERGASSGEAEVKRLLSKFTIDVISQCTFGVRANTLRDGPSRFFTFGTKEAEEFFRKEFYNALSEREKQDGFSNDFVDFMLKLKSVQKKKLEDESVDPKEELYVFEDDKLLAQIIGLFSAGFETTSTTISMALYELALQPHIQDRLRTEIMNKMKCLNGELTYEAINSIDYLDMTIDEVLRKYPPLPFLSRFCTNDYKIPDSDIVLKKGTPVFIALYNGLHYDDNDYPMPERFDPERFLEENKGKRHPYSHIPFGGGPHVCLGKRFGYMTVKATLCKILSNFRVEVCEKTEIPLELDSRALLTTVKKGCYVKFKKI